MALSPSLWITAFTNFVATPFGEPPQPVNTIAIAKPATDIIILLICFPFGLF
jgi:hypothetical protein